MSHHPSQQESRRGFWESRTGWSRLKGKLLLEPLPGGSRWAAAFGSLLLFAFLIQAITGVLLAMNYAPSVESAWPSVNFIEHEVPLGWLIRAAHHWGASAMVILLLAHLVQVFVWGAYKRPRELTWMVGVLLLASTLGLAFTGYLLPWDQKSYWASKVGLGIMSTVPLVGDALRTLLQGGPQIGNLTLTRFFTVHVFLLPGLLSLLVIVHLYLFRLHGVTPPWWESPAQLKAEEEPFWPGQAWKDGVLALAFLLALVLWCSFRPAPLGAEADPAEPYAARPEWYFMFLFQLLKYFKGPYEIVGTFVLPTLFFMVLFFWPWLDRSPQHDPRKRPVAISLLGAGTVGLVGLTIFAIATDVRMREPAIALARQPVAAEPAGPIQKLDVAKIYNDQCAACHGVDGTGSQIRQGLPTIPDFTSLAWQLSQTDVAITHQIQDGKEPLMPAYRDKLTQQQILGLAVYVRAFAIEPIAVAEAIPQATPSAEITPRPKAREAVPPTPPENKQAPPAPPAAQPATTASAQMSTAQVFRAFCLACHGADGRGETVRKAMPEIPDFTESAWQSAHSDSELKEAILNGKGKFMLPMKDKLGGTDVDEMVAFIRSFQEAGQVVAVEPAPLPREPPKPAVILPSEPEVVQPEAAKSKPAPAVVSESTAPSSVEMAARIRVATGLFQQYCLTCHGTGGRGSLMRASMPTIPDFTSRQWQQAHPDAELVASILNGKGTFMPAFEGKVNARQARDLVAYVRAFGPAGVKSAEGAPPSDFETRFRQLQEEWEELEKQLRDVSRPSPRQ